MPDLALAREMHVGHEALRRADVGNEIGEAVEQAEAIVKLHVGARNRRQQLPSRILARLRPRAVPGIDHCPGVGVDEIGDDVAEDRQLIAPALHVLVARARLGELVHELEARDRAERLQADGHA